jgi:hypothetical protein
MALLVVVVAREARADFKEWTVAVTPAYSMVYVDSRTASGGGAAVDVGFGVTESLSVTASGLVSWHSLDATQTMRGGTVSAFAAMLGIHYALDVIRLVPSFDLSLGALGARGGADFGSGANPPIAPSTAFGIALGFGVDYLLERWVAIGAQIKLHALLSDLSRVPAYLYVGPRVTFRFGG